MEADTNVAVVALFRLVLSVTMLSGWCVVSLTADGAADDASVAVAVRTTSMAVTSLLLPPSPPEGRFSDGSVFSLLSSDMTTALPAAGENDNF